MKSSPRFWKENWEETKRHFVDWWAHRGLVLGSWGAPPADQPRSTIPDPGQPKSREDYHFNLDWRPLHNHHLLSGQAFVADTIPIADTNCGPGSLALYLGSEPHLATWSVWFSSCITDPDAHPPLQFDPANKWWQHTEQLLRKSVHLSQGQYLVGCPDLVENLDVLASLRDSQTVLLDMLERPEWVEQKIGEINQVFFDVFDRIYDLIKQPDGGMAFWAFALWGPGKTAKVQCDACCMISSEMFDRFVAPALTAQCRWLDYSMYHLDGTQAMHHLDRLLAIAELDAIEWTPQSGIPGGGSAQWYDLYRKILQAGKSVQAVGVALEEVLPLLDAVGGKGMYIMTNFPNQRAAEEMAQKVEPYRK